jgi:ribose-phosphate pyrophosphokinase
MSATLAFSTQRYAFLRDDVARIARFDVGAIEVATFPDGERYQRVETPISGRDVVLIGGTVSDADTLELFDLACSIAKYGARSLALLIPYFGYSTMERAVKAGEVVTAKTRARLLSAIPLAAAGNRVFLVDLHAEGIPHYFEGGIRPVHIYAKPVIVELARRFGGDDIVLACTDAGRAKWVESLANEMGVPASFVFKRRLDGSHTEVTAMSAAVSGKSVVIYDDMIRTGSSLIAAARAYKAAGAVKLTAIATHGVFPGDALQRLSETGLFSAIACTDTHPRARELAGPSLHVAPIAGVLARALEEFP